MKAREFKIVIYSIISRDKQKKYKSGKKCYMFVKMTWQINSTDKNTTFWNKLYTRTL